MIRINIKWFYKKDAIVQSQNALKNIVNVSNMDYNALIIVNVKTVRTAKLILNFLKRSWPLNKEILNKY